MFTHEGDFDGGYRQLRDASTTNGAIKAVLDPTLVAQ